MTTTFLFIAANCAAAQLSASAERAFESYVANLEARLARQHTIPETYLAALTALGGHKNEGGQKNGLGQLMSGEMQVEPVNVGTWQAGGALLHHWRAAAFVPNATAKDMLTLLRDFSHLSSHYAPEVVSSRALTDNGETATLALRLKERIVIPIVLDAEYEVETRLSGMDRGYSVSRSTHIWEVDNPGTARERRRPPGEDDGFLWRLNSYWSFARAMPDGPRGDPSRREGLLIECEAVSLTRDVPLGLGWLLTPIVADLPRHELEFTLKATRKALSARLAQEENR
jgi:hypothetical protein